jgi:hypothetical protein
MATTRRLKTMEDVRRYLANLINRTENGKVDPNLAGKLGYLANSLARIIEGSTLEKRIEILEKELASKDENSRKRRAS